MQISTKQIGDYVVIKADGRLDASWSEFFTEAIFEYIRDGGHQLVVDASGLQFLSSAGIRSLVRINKELAKVSGSFTMINANDFVNSTLRTTGFGLWLSDSLPENIESPAKSEKTEKVLPENCYVLSNNASVSLKTVNAWKPWGAIEKQCTQILSFPKTSFALGIGCPLSNESDDQYQFGDFLAVCGNVVYQSPETKSRPDYLIPLESYTPEMLAIQAVVCEGNMSHLLRFAPEDNKISHQLSELAGLALSVTGSEIAAFVIIAEIDGLVGAHLIKSPSDNLSIKAIQFPEMRDWLSFSGERVFAKEQALVFGIVERPGHTIGNELLKSMPSNPELNAHTHAVVFPYQPLQNGVIDITQQTEKFFNGPAPKALMHLIEDDRPAIGIGQSTFFRGAMWCASIKSKEVNL